MKSEFINTASKAPGTVAKTIQYVVKPFHIMKASHKKRRNLKGEISFLFCRTASSIINNGINAKKIKNGKPRAGQLNVNNIPESIDKIKKRRVVQLSNSLVVNIRVLFYILGQIYIFGIK